MDTVFLHGLVVTTHLGVHAFEQATVRAVVLDLELAWDCAPVGTSDELADALDYSAVAQAVRHCVHAGRFALIESLAETVAGMVREQFGVGWVRVRASKPGALVDGTAVGVVIERGTRA